MAEWENDECGDSCAICLEPFCASAKATACNCGHVFHSECISNWLSTRNQVSGRTNKQCPTCKADQTARGSLTPLPVFSFRRKPCSADEPLGAFCPFFPRATIFTIDYNWRQN